jgi:hypothetical protein
MSWVDLLGYAASAAVLTTFCMSTMIPLRVLALASNVLFMAYGYVDHLYPVLILHALLFPVNALRLMQFQRLVWDMREANSGDLSIQSLLPYMMRRKFAAGETLVRKGGSADRLYYLLDSELEITRDQQGAQIRGGSRRDRSVCAESEANCHNSMPHRMHPLRPDREQRQAALFPGPLVRLRCATAHYLAFDRK